jgi:hypothetical protein
MAKRKKRSLKGTQIETVALLEYLLAEVYSTGEEKHYRLRMPYGPDAVELVVDLSVYYDGELQDDSEPSNKFKITGPNKKRH